MTTPQEALLETRRAIVRSDSDAIADARSNEAKQKAYLAARQMSIGQMFGKVLKEESTTGWIADRAGGNEFEPDDNFALTTGILNKLTEGIPEEYWDGFESAVSADHAEYLRQSFLRHAANREQLAANGMRAFAVQVAGEFADAPGLVAGLATGGVGAIASKASRAATLWAAARAGLAGGTAFTAAGLVRAEYDPTFRPIDIAMYGVGGAAGGAAFMGLQQASRLSRFSGVGGAQGLGAGAVGFFDDEKTTRDLAIEVASQALLGGTFAALGRAKIDPTTGKAALQAPDAAMLGAMRNAAKTAPDGPATVSAAATEILAASGYAVEANTPSKPLSVEERAQELVDTGEAVDIADATEMAKMEAKKANRIPSDETPQSSQRDEPDQDGRRQGAEQADADDRSAGSNDRPAQPGRQTVERAPKRGEFSRDDIADRVRDAYVRDHGDDYEYSDLHTATERDDTSNDLLSTNFSGPLPGEVLDYIDKGAPGWRWRRMQFKANTGRGGTGGEDSLAALGPDEYFKRIEALFGEKTGRHAEPYLSPKAIEHDPVASWNAWMLTHIPPKGAAKRISVVDKPGETLRPGDRFTLWGNPFEIVVDPEYPGLHLLVEVDGHPRTFLEVLETLPIDKGSLQRAAAAPSDPASIIAQAREGEPIHGMGAASQSTIERGETELGFEPTIDFDLSRATTGYTTHSSRIVRLSDPSSTMSTSAVPGLRYIGNAIATDVLGPAKGPSIESAMEWTVTRKRLNIVDVDDIYAAAYIKHRDWSVERGNRPLSRDDFYEQVAFATRRYANITPDDPGIVHAIENGSALMGGKTGLGMAQRRGVPWASSVEARKDYMTRAWSARKIDALAAKHGPDGPLETVVGAFMARNPEATPKVAVAIGKAIVNRGGRGRSSRSDSIWTAFYEGDIESIELILNDSGADPRSIAEVLEYFKNKTESLNTQTGPSHGTTARLKQRVDLDETYVHRWIDENGVEQAIGIEDMLINDARELTVRYMDSMAHATAMSEIARHYPVGVNGKAPPPTVEGIMKAIRKDVEDYRGGQREDKRIALAEDLLKLASGVPLTDPTVGTDALDLLRQFNMFSILLSNVGSAIGNAAEIGKTASIQWGKVVMQRMAGSLWDILQDTKISPENRNYVQHLAGAGLEWAAGRVRPAHHEADTRLHRAVQATNQAMKHAGRFASGLSPIGRVQSWLSGWAANCVGQQLYNIAKSGEAISDKRLRAFGIEPHEWPEVAEGILKHAIVGPGGFLRGIDHGAWNTATAARFRVAIQRESRALVINPDPTQVSMWFNKPIGRVFIDLRRFMVSSWQASTLRTVHLRDAQAFTSIFVEGITASAAYYTRTQLESIGKPDREAWLEERLEPEKILLAGFGRTSFASIMPTLFDTVWADALQRPALLTQGRTTTPGGLITGNPTFDWAKSAIQAGGALGSAVFDDDYFTKKDVQNITRATFVPRIWGLHNFIMQMADDLPERAPAIR